MWPKKSEPTPSDREVLTGLVERVTYQNAESGFCVLRVKARGFRVRLSGFVLAATRPDCFAREPRGIRFFPWEGTDPCALDGQ
jgi:hypothetical protein